MAIAGLNVPTSIWSAVRFTGAVSFSGAPGWRWKGSQPGAL